MKIPTNRGELIEILRFIRTTDFDTSTPEGRTRERNRRIILNSIASVFARVAVAGVSLAIVPMLLGNFDKEIFGMWATITATAAWFTLFDLGIINGLVNAISEAYGKDDRNLSAGYVSTTFFTLLVLSVVASVFFLAISKNIQWNTLFAIGINVDINTVRLTVTWAALPLLLGMPFSVVRQIYAGYQKAYVGYSFAIAGSILTVFTLYIAIRNGLPLYLITAIFTGVPGLFAALNFLYLAKIEMPWLSPRISKYSWNSLKRLLRTSIPLFLFQIGALLVNQSQPIVLAHQATLEIVADYSVIIKLQLAFMSLILMSTIAFVPTFREANERGDHAWVKNSFYRMLKIRMFLTILFGATLLIGGNILIKLWLGESAISYGIHIWIVIIILMIVSTWVTAYSDLLIIMDRIWPQVFIVLLNGVSILFLTFILSPIFGLMGALIGTTAFTLFVSSWLVPLLARPFLSQNKREV